VATGENECETVVGNRAHVLLLGRQRLQPCQQLCFLREDLLAPDPVDRAVPGGRDDPGAWVPRHPVIGPAFQRDRERFLHRVLGE